MTESEDYESKFAPGDLVRVTLDIRSTKDEEDLRDKIGTVVEVNVHYPGESPIDHSPEEEGWEDDYYIDTLVLIDGKLYACYEHELKKIEG
jgi:hypothetical protein